MKNIEILSIRLSLEFVAPYELDSFSTDFLTVSCVPLFRPTRTHVRVQAVSYSAQEIFAACEKRARQVAAERAAYLENFIEQ